MNPLHVRVSVADDVKEGGLKKKGKTLTGKKR